MARVTKEALAAVRATLNSELQAAHSKLRLNKDLINKLSQEQRTLKSKCGELYRLLRLVGNNGAK